MARRLIPLLLGWACCSPTVRAEPGDEAVGSRPYEMVWANRTEDDHPPLIDFELLDGWTVECVDAEAAFTRSREQQLWGQFVGKLVYRGAGKRPMAAVKPPQPIPTRGPFDCINFWVYGNNWAWVSDKSTPQVEIALRFQGEEGQTVRIPMDRVRWKEWWVLHRKLNGEQLKQLGPQPLLEAIEVSGGRNEEDRALFFDNLSVYQEALPPLEFDPRPERNLTLFPGQSPGTNTGPGRLPFPTREETLLPDNLTSNFNVELEERDGGYLFRYRGDDGELVYRYQPQTGTLGDVTAEWIGRGKAFRPMAGGGVYFAVRQGEKAAPPEVVEPAGVHREGETVVSAWRCRVGDRSAEVRYTFRLWRKSLVVDVECLGGAVGEVRLGRAEGVENPRLIALPFLAGEAQRPNVLAMGPPDRPLFAFAIVDHYRSNASSLFADNKVSDEGAVYNGGSRYAPRTDGVRNDCFERLFLTVSPRFEEILPNIANPQSPWKHVAGERVWIAYGAGHRENDYAYWKNIARHGMTKIAITDHEVGWRDGGESFTMRTRAAPGKGGDEGQADYARKLRALGFRYGIYNNYTDYAPVNEHWNEDYVTRLSDGNWQSAWARCYNPKPSRAVELEAKLAPIIQQKFQLDTAYCDVHTAVQPWRYCDFDARVPGAGTFAATFYAYGEIMLHQKKTWNGPVYSEGNNHWYYSGLTDGNYGQDQAARLAENPWLVDFNLRKIHPLECNFGMGNPGMFYGREERLGDTPEERTARLDRFLAATLAFGHTGFLIREGGTANTVRSYFTVQQVHKHYAQETADEIRYANAAGALLDSSAAVATGAFERSQVRTRYSNGLTVSVNGHMSEPWETAGFILPPNGWCVQGSADAPVTAFSALMDGHRVDYVDSPDYLYADGRGRFTRFEKIAANGPVIVHKRDAGVLEVIPVAGCADFGVSLNGCEAAAVALDADGKELGPAETRFSRGLAHVTPLAGAFSYRLTPRSLPAVALRCDRDQVVPGETVRVLGAAEHVFQIPADAVPGDRLWRSWEDAWMDFTVVPLVDASLAIGQSLNLSLASRLGESTAAEATLAGHTRPIALAPGATASLEFPFARPGKEEVRELLLEVRAGELRYGHRWWLRAENALAPLAELGTGIVGGRRLRDGEEEPLDSASGAQVLWTERACGGETRPTLFMHPPYKTGVGYAYALFGPIDLPKEPAAAFRCEIGKADGSDAGDGVLFRVAIVAEDGSEMVAAERSWMEHAWTPLEADLTQWAGQRVRLKLISDVGPANNSSGDWACWTGMRVESREPVLDVTLHEEPVALRFEPGPRPAEGLSAEQLRKAASVTLHYQAIGLQCGGQYVSHGRLNGAPLGPVPSAGGNEQEGVWGEGRMPLGPEAVALLDLVNQFAIDNPGNDCFKIRRVWLEVVFPDGRSCTSRVSTPTYTQPPNWLYSEGTGVPFGQQIQVEIRF